MTDKERELALYCLKASSDYHSEVCEECINYPNCDHTIQDDVTETIIKALEQEPCENHISRQYLLDNCVVDKVTMPYVPISRIQEAPSVNPQPKTGHWIIKDGKEQGYDIGGVKTWYIQIMCDKCGFIKNAIEGHTGQYQYCPNCGAKMESEEV